MVKQTLNQPIPDKKATFFKSDLKTDTLKTAFANIYETHLGDWKAIKTELTPDKGFTPEIVQPRSSNL